MSQRNNHPQTLAATSSDAAVTLRDTLPIALATVLVLVLLITCLTGTGTGLA